MGFSAGFEWVAIGLFAILAIYLAHRHWPRSGNDLYDHHRRGMSHHMQARGLGTDDRHDEALFRHAMVRLRRRASEAATKEPGRALQIILELAAEEAKTLGFQDKTVARRFASAVKETDVAHILYRGAMKKVKAHHRSVAKHHSASADHIASVTTL